MIRILIAEDEPAAMRYITSLLATHCSRVEIVAQAEDGIEAKKTLENMPVDILITDIQMPRMNGIKLAQWVAENKPDVLTLIVSGYSEFEYAKEAIQAGVVEYLLKPFTPAVFANSIEKMCQKVDKRQRSEREHWLKRAIAGVGGNDCFPGFNSTEQLTLGILIRGAAADSFNPPDRDFKYPPNTSDVLAATYIHDESMICFALKPAKTEQDALIELLSLNSPYYTAYYKVTVPGEDSHILSRMLQAAKRTAIPGKSQKNKYTGVIPPVSGMSREEQSLIKQLQYSVDNAQTDNVKSRLLELFTLWETKECPLLSAEMTLTKLMQSIAHNAPPGHGISQLDIAETVGLFCREAVDYPDMLDSALKLCSKVYSTLDRMSGSGQLINNIETYISEHLGQPLSAQSISSVFGISLSYLHRIFRKHINMSLVEYITQRRIEEARRMLSAYPDMSIKDISGYLGFSDQFYFSKVFRSATGIAPSEYRSRKE